MDEISSLAKSLMVLDDKLASCMKCGFCQAFCPVFDTTGKEGDVTRGKIALVENLAHLIIQDPEAVNEKLSRCLLCGGCQFSCPSGVPTLEIFMERGPSSRPIWDCPRSRRPFSESFFPTRAWWIRSCAPVRRSRNCS